MANHNANYLTDLTRKQATSNARREAFRFQPTGSEQWQTVTWADFAATVDLVAAAMAWLKIKPTDCVAVFSANSPEILYTDFGCYRNRAVPVSLYSTSSPDQVHYILHDCSARMIVCGDRKQLDIALAKRAACPALRYIVAANAADLPKNYRSQQGVMSYDELLALGREHFKAVKDELDKRTAEASADDVATLIYTSGTTGEPKGAILPHRCFNAAIDIHNLRLTMVSDRDTSLCFLPLSHIFEKAWTYFCLTRLIRVAINRDPRAIQNTIRQIRPSCMCSVPRFWEKAYTAVNEKLDSAKGLRAVIIRRALAVGRKRNLEYKRLGRKVPAWLEARYKFYDRRVLSTIRRALGVDHGNIFPTAGAPLSANIVEFFICCGINIVIGYGLSETTATVTCYPTKDYIIGSVGTPLPEIEVRIGDNNEVQVKAPTVMRGYHGRPEATAQAFTADGWFRTGDAGHFDSEGALVLTDRIKDLFKTSNGKYIAPQALETRLGEDRFIEQVAVIGDSRKYVTAIIIPAFEALKEYARNHRIDFSSIEDLIQNSDIRSMIEQRIERLQKNFAPFEKIKKFILSPNEFSIESGELTNTLKLRRPVINSHYADQIEAMYAG